MKSGFKLKMLSTAMMLSMSVMLSGCLGGGSDSSVSASTTLVGTVAGGAAMIGTVWVKDSLGEERSATIEADGHYELNVSDMTGPFILRATGEVGDTHVTYYSAATDADLGGRINITPFTNLMIANVANQLAEDFYDNFEDESGALTDDALDQAETALQEKLQPILSALGLGAGIDLLRESFTTDHSGLDAALDLVRVEINTETSIATLTNTLTNATLGTDDVSTNDDDDTSLDSEATEDLTDAIPNALTAATSLSQWFSNFEALFASDLPDETEMTNSNLFDTTDHFLDGGSNYDQFVGDVFTDDQMIGIRFTNTAITFTNADQTQAKVTTLATFGDGSTETVDLVFEKQGDVWKYVGDQQIVYLDVETIAVRNIDSNSDTLNSGLDLWLEVEDYNGRANANPNDSLIPISYAVVTGPGLPTGGVTMTQQNQNYYLTIENGNGTHIYDCQGATGNCLTLANTVDNGEYNVKLYSAGGQILNGSSGYTGKLRGLKPLATSALTNSMFPNITSLKINNIVWTQLQQLISSNTTLRVDWTLPSGYRSDNLDVWGYAGVGTEFVRAEEELTASQTDASLVLGDTSTYGQANNAGLWLSAYAADGRRYAIRKSLP